MMRLALQADAVTTSEAIEIGATRFGALVRAELGIRPAIEVVHLLGLVAGTVAIHELHRGQESTDPDDWPTGTALALVPANEEPSGESTLYLARPLAAGSSRIDLGDVYRRLRVGSETVWERQLVGEPPGRTTPIKRFAVERAREGTEAADHPAGASVQFLAPGES